MCIIAIKKQGIELPTDDTIENMWLSNPDGAGFMYTVDNTVYIKKGYMTLEALKTALKDLKTRYNVKDIPLIMHFRIGTSGGNIPENTHPFPVSESIEALQRLRIKTSLGVVHNGIIDIEPSAKNLSDTMEYIKSQLSLLYKLDKSFYTREIGQKLVKNAIKSKMAFLDSHGQITTIGEFYEDKGIFYSNYSYYPVFSYDKWDIYEGYKTKTKDDLIALMWLSDDDGYILDGAKIYEAGDYLMDKNGKLYSFSEDDYCYPVEGNAFTHESLPLKFDYSRADYFPVLGMEEMQ